MLEVLQSYIDGKWVDAIDGARFDVHNPATGEVIATAPACSAADAEVAIAAARRTFDEGLWWPGTPERERGRILLRAAEIVMREHERLSRLESRDNGKPITEAREDIREVSFMLEYYGGWATKLAGEVQTLGTDAMTMVLREPVGVVAAIPPWNYPMMMATQKVAPAIAAGCTIVLKPASYTPFTAIELAKILEEAGLPPGVLNVLTGAGSVAGAHLVQSPLVDKVSLTGSTAVGTWIMRESAATMKRVSLELGGKSPNIVYADADFEAAVQGSCNGIFWNQGEICSAGSRVLVERSIYDEALQAMSDRAKAIRLGDPLDEATTMGPIVSPEQKAVIDGFLEVGRGEATVAVEGEVPTDPALTGGYWVPPTIFTDVTNDMTIAREEIFGPVMAVIPFDTPEEAIAIANDSEYGLAAAIWTRDLAKAITTARALRAGIIWINDSQPAPTEMPWGGYKRSGIGRELGKHGIDDFLEDKAVYINLGG
jgi:acyl-CoA reductase-like NAD-dependent aldehyde dehydrogenase